MSFENFVYLSICLFCLTFFTLLWVNDQKQIYYWRGRKDGWDMHRRLNQLQKKDEVFDYDKN
jgi:hypothetical protein